MRNLHRSRTSKGALAVSGLALLIAWVIVLSGSANPETASAHRTASAGPATGATATPHGLDTPTSPKATPPAINASTRRRIIDTTYPAPSLSGRRHVLVLLPEHYDSSHARYPVVEFLHGHPGVPIDLFNPARGALLSYANASGIAPFIAVIPDGNGPALEDSWWADIAKQHMATAATRDLRKWASARFRTNDSWSYAGLSTGGYGAAYLPTVDTLPVHAECGLSGFYDSSRVPIPPHSSLALRAQYSPIAHVGHAPALVFLAYGDRDAKTKLQTNRYAAALRKAHHTAVVRVYPGGHQWKWKVWPKGFEQCLRLVVPAKRSQ